MKKTNKKFLPLMSKQQRMTIYHCSLDTEEMKNEFLLDYNLKHYFREKGINFLQPLAYPDKPESN